VFLGNLGRLELLRYKGHEVYIARAVAEGIAEKPDAAAQTVQIGCATWIQVGNVTDETAVPLVQASLHRGEAEAIALVLAMELYVERLVMDEQDARRFANNRGLIVIGIVCPRIAVTDVNVVLCKASEVVHMRYTEHERVRRDARRRVVRNQRYRMFTTELIVCLARGAPGERHGRYTVSARRERPSTV